MKAIIALLLLLFYIFAPAQGTEQRNSNWQLIPYYKNSPGYITYFNQNNKSVIPNQDKGIYKIAEILISAETPANIDIGGKPVLIHSIIKVIMVECESAALLPLYDFYYKEKMPNRFSTPDGGIEHNASESAIKILDKSSPIYKVVCPVYI